MEKKELLNAIEKVRPGISSNTDAFEQSDSIFFNNDSISAYNGEVAVFVPFDVGISGWVKAEEVYKLVRKMKGDEIEIDQDGNRIEIKCGKTTAKFNHVTEDIAIPDLGIADIKRWKKLPDKFCDAISFCEFSASSDISRGVLNFIHVSGKVVESCDNYRATSFTLPKDIKDEIFIPKTSAKNFELYEPTHYQLTTGWAHFRNNATSVVYSVRTCSEEFVSLDRLLQTEGSNFEFPEEVKESIELAEVFAWTHDKMRQKVISIEVKKGLISVKSENENGEVTDEIKTDYKGNSFDFNIPAEYLLTILKSMKKCIVGEGKSAGKILFTGDNFEHVIAMIKKN